MADLPPHDHASRRERLRVKLDRDGIALLVVTHAPNIRYLSGFTGSNGQLLVGADGSDLLITDHRYDGRAADEAPGLERVLDRDWIGQVVERATQLPAPLSAFEGPHLPYDLAMELHDRLGQQDRGATPAPGLVEELREVKDPSELARIEAACQLTDQAWEALLDWLEPDISERDVARFVARTMEDLGAGGLAFPTIVASGPNAAVPHHEPGDRVLEEGDLVTIDMGAVVDGYHADMTRTVALGEPSDRLLHVYELVQQAQERAVEGATAGTDARDVDAAARDALGDDAEHFIHGTGHGVGLEIHERPAVSRDSTGSLRPDTVITVEPGIYLPGVGGVRIEDTVVVTDDGPARRLTTSPRDLVRL